MTSIGQIGEQFVAQWLSLQGWQILHKRWRSPWGEIDLIAQEYNPNLIIFVEVKTRKSRNWDQGGVLAVTLQKQDKIRQTAAYFLGENPHLAEFYFRFDVALVHYIPSPKNHVKIDSNTIKIGQSVQYLGFQLTLLDYLESAF